MFFNYFISFLLAFAFPPEALRLLDVQPGEEISWSGGEEAQKFDAVVCERARPKREDLESVKQILKPGGRALLLFAPWNSCENRILELVAPEEILSVQEVEKILREEGWEIDYFEVRKEARVFPTLEELSFWIEEEMAIDVAEGEKERFVQEYIQALEKVGAVRDDGVVWIPYLQIIALVKAPDEGA